MPRVVRGGLIQASIGEEASAPVDHLKKLLIDKHVALIEGAARRDVQVLYHRGFCSTGHTSPPSRTPDGTPWSSGSPRGRQ